MIIRPETREDREAVRYINEQAFGRDNEANLIEALRATNQTILSLVAVQDDRIIGHILFSSVKIKSEKTTCNAVGLGPMAVLPRFQRQGVGSKLVRKSLENLRHDNHDLVIVLGHPVFYKRFGFVSASTFGINCQFEVPDEVFMAMGLWHGAAIGKNGIAIYASEFNDV